MRGEEEKFPEPRKSKTIFSYKKSWLIFTLIVVFGLFFIAGNTIKVPYTAMVTYTEKEPYETQEPYQDQESYTVEECEDIQVPYTDEVCETRDYDYWVENHRSWKDWTDSNYVCLASFVVKNNENKGGYWTFSYVFYSTNKEIKRPSQSKYVYPLSTRSWTFSYDCDVAESVTGNYFVESVPKFTVCETIMKYKTEKQCKNVTKYQTITKYRTVTKYRDVERQREETGYQTLFDGGFDFTKFLPLN